MFSDFCSGYCQHKKKEQAQRILGGGKMSIDIVQMNKLNEFLTRN